MLQWLTVQNYHVLYADGPLEIGDLWPLAQQQSLGQQIFSSGPVVCTHPVKNLLTSCPTHTAVGFALRNSFTEPWHKR